jgi:hypothetical protein
VVTTNHVLAFARTLPGIRETYLMRRVTIRANRRAFLVFAEDGDPVVRIPKSEHEALLSGSPDVFTPASSHTWLKVRLVAVQPDTIEYLVTRAWQATQPRRTDVQGLELPHATAIVHRNGHGMLLHTAAPADRKAHGVRARKA